MFDRQKARQTDTRGGIVSECSTDRQTDFLFLYVICHYVEAIMVVSEHIIMRAGSASAVFVDKPLLAIIGMH